MAYFEKFPLTYYRFDNKSDPILISHILTRFKVREKVKPLIQTAEYYLVGDFETPELIAFEKYGDPKLHWLVLLFNDILDPFKDWVLDSVTFEEYVIKKYDDVNATHHWVIDGLEVPAGTPNAIAVTNFQYEFDLNEAKRKIKLPKKDHIRLITNELDSVLREEI